MKIIVLKIKNELICAALLRDKIQALERMPVFSSDLDSSVSVGSVYVGRVENVVPSIRAAFVRFHEGETGYLPFSEVPENALFNREYQAKSPLKSGDLLAVQVERSKTGMKQTALTGYIGLSSKLSAVTFGTAGFSVSKKLNDELRSRMRDDLQASFRATDEADFLQQSLVRHALTVRTDAGPVYENNRENACVQITNDAAVLLKKSEEIRSRGSALKAESLLYRPEPILQLEDKLLKLIRFSNQTVPDEETDIVCEDASLYEKLTKRGFTAAEKKTDIKLHASADVTLDALYQISKQLEELQKRIVWLKSGAFLVIDKTEAMTVVDVNSGKNIKNKEDDFLALNMEAAEETLRQLRLRDHCGIIIIDFINMRHETTRDALKKEIKKMTKADPVRTQFVDFTQLGLAELTREKH